jgi:hypothetical protein
VSTTFDRIAQQVERQAAMMNRIMRQQQLGMKTAAIFNRISREQRQIAVIAGAPLPRGQDRRGTPLAHIRCVVCGERAGTVEVRGRQMRVVAGRRRYLSLAVRPVKCSEHGPLDVTWEHVETTFRGTARRPASIHAAPTDTPN